MRINQVKPNQIMIKRRFRYFFEISNVLTMRSLTGLNQDFKAQAWAVQATRPTAQFDETEVRHVSEIVYYPTRIRWEPITVTLIDVHKSNQIYNWLYALCALDNSVFSYFDNWHGYEPVTGSDSNAVGDTEVKRDCMITMFNGIGETLERWMLQGSYPQSVNFGELDYTSNDFATVELTLRYDRAFIDDAGSGAQGGSGPSVSASGLALEMGLL